MQGNDGRARVRLPDEPLAPAREPARGVSVRPTVQATDPALLHALEAHNTTLKADVERLEAQLAAAEARTTTAEARLEKQAAEFAERFAQHSSDMAAERAQTEKAIAEFSVLAERLAALAEERSRPWWRRIVG
jgi:hypothetical protein